ncbi:MAG TPA: transposase family protein [Xanthobacteraceae bacterium]|nr:transposase family protein [Xanthobacteraceae bacterium]
MNARSQYLETLRKEYAGAGEGGRSRLLDEAEKRTGLNRKYLIRVLNHGRPKREHKRRKRRAQYGAALVTALVEIWDIFEQPCGQRLAAVLGTEVDRLRRLGEVHCSDAVAEQLKEISASTIDRLLAREKRVRGLRRNRNPNMQRLIYQKVPVKVVSDWDTSEIGNVQVDFVAHCGRSTGGDYIHTISAVDIATNWWEGQAIAVRSQQASKEGLNEIRSRFPFRIRELHPDNDSALVNDLLWDWAQQQKIRLSRSRPYKKNDNAWVEQKNWTHVRKIVGYRRFDTTSELRLLNEIYAVLRLYKNFCLPTIRLASKVRVEGKIKRKYDQPLTPYQRLMESGQIDRKTKRLLQTIDQGLNPAALCRRLTELRSELERVSAGGSESYEKPRYRGPDIRISKRRNPMEAVA